MPSGRRAERGHDGNECTIREARGIVDATHDDSPIAASLGVMPVRGSIAAQPTTVYIGLGANLGDREAHLRAALARLAPEVEVTAVSPVYETEPVGPPDQPRFLNAVCRARTRLAPLDLLARFKSIEHELGRRPGRVWGPRPADLDLLLYGDEPIDLPDLRVPHPRLAERAFVLVPLADLAPDLVLPSRGLRVRDLLQQVDQRGVAPFAPRGWEGRSPSQCSSSAT